MPFVSHSPKCRGTITSCLGAWLTCVVIMGALAEAVPEEGGLKLRTREEDKFFWWVVLPGGYTLISGFTWALDAM